MVGHDWRVASTKHAMFIHFLSRREVVIQFLVGGLEHFLFFHILGIMIPTDEVHHFFRGVQTTNQYYVLWIIPSGKHIQKAIEHSPVEIVDLP